ncbi:MAG TPA: hypothetical protein VMF69_07175 [Gemmataceae bacterium]|nr:hypothetical protein [Gemmataceae bacterium]
MGAFRRCLIFPSLGVPLACLSVVLLAPPSARAGCDYPTHVERTPVDLPSNFPTAPQSDTRLPRKPCPCTGPHCSRQPLAPPVPTLIDSVNISEWGRLLPPPLVVPPRSDHWTPEIPFARPARHPSVIFHPPRLAL